MGGPLSFPQPTERAFLQERLRGRFWHLCGRLAGVLKWAGLLAAGWSDGGTANPLALALTLLSTAALLLAWKPLGLGKRIFFACEVAIDILQPLLACTVFNQLYPHSVGAGPLRAVACVLAGNGVLALAIRAKASPLPFRWQLPALLATCATLLAQTRTLCSSGLLQHGFRALHTLARILLPIAAPAFIHLMPREGFAALLAPATEANAEGAALCAAYQMPSVVLSCLLLACHLYAAEVQQRKAFLAAASTASAAHGRAAQHAQHTSP